MDRREEVKASRRKPIDSQERSAETKALCYALWEEMQFKPPQRSASNTVLKNLLKLSYLRLVRSKEPEIDVSIISHMSSKPPGASQGSLDVPYDIVVPDGHGSAAHVGCQDGDPTTTDDC